MTQNQRNGALLESSISSIVRRQNALVSLQMAVSKLMSPDDPSTLVCYSKYLL